MIRFFLRMLTTVVLLCATALCFWIGVLGGYGAFAFMALILLFLAYENAYKAFFGSPD